MIIEHFKGNFVVCELENGSFANSPKDVLPSGAAEGSKLLIFLDNVGEAAERERIKEKMDK